MIYPALLVLTAIGFSFLAWQDKKMAIFFVLAALPSYLLRFHIGPVPMTLLEVFVLIVIARSLRHFPLRNDTFIIPIVLLLIAVIVSTIVSPNTLAALGILKAYFVEPILFYFTVKSTLSHDDIEPAFKALGIGAIIVSILGIMQWVTNLGIPAPWDIERRVTSIFDFPNAVGLYLGPIVTIATMMFAKTKKVFWLVVLTLGGTTIFLAQTEAAYVAIPASLLAVSFLEPRLRRFTIPLTIIGIVVAIIIAPVRQKLTLHDYSGEVRRTQWSETVTMLKDHPIFGAGLAGYETIFTPYHKTDWIEIFQYPHNIVLNIWSELGILGLIAFVVLAIQTLRIAEPFKRPPIITIAILAALLEMTIHGLVDVPYFKNDLSLMTWSLLALLVITHQTQQTKI